MAVVSVLRSGTSRDPNMMVLLCHLFAYSCLSVLCFYCLSNSREGQYHCWLVIPLWFSQAAPGATPVPPSLLAQLPWFDGKMPIYLANGRSLAQRTAEVSVSSSDNIETHQLWARFVTHQSLTNTVVNIVRLSRSTVSLGGELQCVVEIRWSIKWQT